ncbi:ABC transporter permease [Azospirillum sp. TSH100]|uniref:high-affinity branched-chain amino acid ABC transporter permease LivM n=2 Tax=Azospirillum TaxID=191 RepID=UPI000D6093F6|nr:high-affinity branched-chain amino acid ABC transporter permease LivM [Azospirillum sp. TSH100]PWC73273.1 ABC transporter permease [Azospirillum sp. TSH100]QCG91324.1 high-affinity branched-chain amino acid ABC transporter permease LivM [Azospirillum sp. TSH100]QCG91891.1 high-affinity branched-chain amino acid ABC transporter permease LivM [Azospirillum sp. TSH100]
MTTPSHAPSHPHYHINGKRPGVDWAATVKDAGLAAFVALLLTVPLVGLRTVDRPTGLGIEARPEEVIASLLLVFLGRLGLGLIRQGMALPVLILALVCAGVGLVLPMPTQVLRLVLVLGGGVIALRAAMTVATGRSKLSQADRDKRMDRVAAKVQHASRYIGPVAVAFAAVLPLTPLADRMILDIGILLLTYIMLGWGLNIVVGLAGLLDLGYVAFYAVGAYSYALLAHYFGLSFWLCLPLAGLLAACSGVLLGFPVLRLRGDYFAIVTLGFGEIIRIILVNWYQFTGGPNGISGIPRPSFFGIADFSRTPAEGMAAFHELFGLEFSPLHRIIFLYYLILALALVVNLFTLRVRKLPLGRAWEALREDDIACASLGINRTNMKLAAFAIAAMFGGFAGSFFATRQGFISPESFTFIESAIILAIVVLGGMGSQIGVVVATLLVIGLPEAFRELADYRMLAFGAGMVVIMLWRPRGLLAHRDPTILLHGGKKAAATGAAK